MNDYESELKATLNRNQPSDISQINIYKVLLSLYQLIPVTQRKMLLFVKA